MKGSQPTVFKVKSSSSETMITTTDVNPPLEVFAQSCCIKRSTSSQGSVFIVIFHSDLCMFTCVLSLMALVALVTNILECYVV